MLVNSLRKHQLADRAHKAAKHTMRGRPVNVVLLVLVCIGRTNAQAASSSMGMSAAAAAVDASFVAQPGAVDLAANTVKLPIHRATLADNTAVYFIVTEASSKDAAAAWGASHAPALVSTAGSAVVQRGFPAAADALAATGVVMTPAQPLRVNATVNFTHGKRSVTPDPKTGFPPTNFSFSAQGNKGYSPLLQLPDGTVLNAPHVAVALPSGGLALHPKVVSVSPDRRSVVLALTQGFSQGQPIVYISTEASDPLAATLENVPYVPLLADTPKAALVDLVAFANGQVGKDNPQRQGLGSALKDNLGPLNIAANTPSSPAYSPLWAVNLAKWVGEPGDRQTSVASVKALAAAGKVSSLDPMHPAATPALKPSGIVVNCPIMATVSQQSDPRRGGAAASKGSGSRCERSTLGYSCVVRPQPGVAIHFSMGGSQPPRNPCTASSATTASMQQPIMMPSAASAQAFAHFAVETAASGFVGMSFPQTAGKMWPADAVIGTSQPAASRGGAAASQVQAYHLTRYGVSPSDQNDGWVQHRGQSIQDGRRVMCFSRALDAPEAAVVKSINPSTDLAINWATSDSNSLQQMHSQMGFAIINLNGGGATLGGDGANEQLTYRVAHGAMMLAAFVLLMPTAALIARHKWLFGDKEAGTIKGGWFAIHRIFNILALVLAVAAAAVIFSRFQWAGRADTAPYYTWHRALGLTALGMMVVQGVLGAARPHLGTLRRPAWRRVHQAWGWLTLLVGTTVCYMGISLIHDLSGLRLGVWLGCALATTGVLVLAGVVLEVMKFRLERAGNYNKNTHKVFGAAALPSKAMKADDKTTAPAE